MDDGWESLAGWLFVLTWHFYISTLLAAVASVFAWKRTMATPNAKFQSPEDEIKEALAKAHPLPVQYCCKVLLNYSPHPDHNPPHFSHTATLRPKDFVHFKTLYNKDWWIGRVVGPETKMTFVPSKSKFLSVTSEGVEEVYQHAPVMRPLVLLGPSSKCSELTRLLHKPLLNYVREKFSGRLITIKPEYSVNKDMGVKEIRVLEGDIYAAASTMNLVLLDSDASYPEDFDTINLHPHFIYVKIARQKVLQSLIEQLTKSSREREAQLHDASHLFENSSKCSLVISDSNVDDACLSLELFLESYWAATRSVDLFSKVDDV